jgi:hypothetical protein
MDRADRANGPSGAARPILGGDRPRATHAAIGGLVAGARARVGRRGTRSRPKRPGRRGCGGGEGPAQRTIGWGCKAEGPSLEKIRSALLDVQASLGIAPNLLWLRAYYQMANRLAFLWFARLRGDQQPLWLVWVYFLGERYSTATGVSVGPEDPEAWAPVIAEAHSELGLPETHELSVFEATVFLPALAPPEGSPA